MREFCVAIKKQNLLFVYAHEIFCVHQQRKNRDIPALHIVQEIGECRGMPTNQGAQLNKTLADREEEMSALLTQCWTHTLCRLENTHIYHPAFLE